MILDYFGKNEREIILEICEENKRLRSAQPCTCPKCGAEIKHEQLQEQNNDPT
jgi:hypothetical protein